MTTRTHREWEIYCSGGANPESQLPPERELELSVRVLGDPEMSAFWQRAAERLVIAAADLSSAGKLPEGWEVPFTALTRALGSPHQRVRSDAVQLVTRSVSFDEAVASGPNGPLRGRPKESGAGKGAVVGTEKEPGRCPVVPQNEFVIPESGWERLHSASEDTTAPHLTRSILVALYEGRAITRGEFGEDRGTWDHALSLALGEGVPLVPESFEDPLVVRIRGGADGRFFWHDVLRARAWKRKGKRLPFLELPELISRAAAPRSEDELLALLQDPEEEVRARAIALLPELRPRRRG